ncbi:MAG: hypothetical protein PUG74_08635 [Prevotellaceae bacterium]|nr:hypothetical protein [Prevotellaceae bacterium]
MSSSSFGNLGAKLHIIPLTAKQTMLFLVKNKKEVEPKAIFFRQEDIMERKIREYEWKSKIGEIAK